jgi:hypothetical protein
MPVVKHLRESHKAKTRDYLQKWADSAAILARARALARSGRFATQREIERELDRLWASDRARDWFLRFEIRAQLDRLCEVARSKLPPPKL